MRSMVPPEYGYHIGLDDGDDLGSLGLDVEEDDLGNVEDIPKQRIGNGPRPNDGKTRLILSEEGHIQLSVGGKTADTTIEVLGYLHLQYDDLGKLLLYKYLTTEGSQQPAAGATDIFNSKISIPLNGGSDPKRTFNLHYQAECKEGTSRAIYGPEGSGIDQIMNELGEIEGGLKDYGIDVDKRTGGIIIDGVNLSPDEIRSVLEAAELCQLFEDGHSNAYGRKQHEFPQPYVDKLKENVLPPDIREGYEVTVLNYSKDLFGVKAIKSLP